MSALSTSDTRGDEAATTLTARFTTAITSSHSPSTLVNIALVSQGSPESRTHLDGLGDGRADAARLVAAGRADAECYDHGRTLPPRRNVISVHRRGARRHPAWPPTTARSVRPS